MYRAIIVEDDPMITQINSTFLEQDHRFQLVNTFQTGQQALSWLLVHQVDLLLLDLYMPEMTGLELLRELRSRGGSSDVIMVTAANDSHTVDALMKLGVTDYLVKPFTSQRFQQALDNFCRHREAISAHNSVSQTDLDALFSPNIISPSSPVPKGLQAHTLTHIQSCLSLMPDAGCTCELLAEHSGLSSVTVRRYLTYLVDCGKVSSRVNYDTGGRPSILYSIRSP